MMYNYPAAPPWKFVVSENFSSEYQLMNL
ncbi:hypothetical protein IL54_3273 [Sphingobium sp. ba1]|nr:hypothetical protein IL54_3273 [Sphingobium sp. ba1]